MKHLGGLKRPVAFYLQLTPEEDRLLTDIAAALDRPPSWYVRWACFQRLPAGDLPSQIRALVTAMQAKTEGG